MWTGHDGHGMGLGRMGRAATLPANALTPQHMRRIAGYLRPYLWQLGILFVCVAATASVGVVPPLIIRAIIDQALPQHNNYLLNLLILGMIIIPVIRGLIGVLQNYLNTLIGQGVMFDLRNQLFHHLQRLSLHFYTTTPTGQIMSRVTNDVAAIQNTVTGTLVGIVTSIVTIAVTLSVIFALNNQLALLAVLILPTFVLPMRYIGNVRQRIARETQQQQADLTAHMQERLSVSGFLLMRLFGRAREEQQTFRHINRALTKLQIRQAMVGRWFMMITSILTALGPALIYWYGGRLVIQGQLSVGTIVAFVAYLGNLYRPVTNIASVYIELRGAMGVFERIFEYLDIVPEIQECPTARPLSSIRGHICFDNVAFTYPHGQALALDHVSFEIQPGQLAALVGPSGSGKTTVTYLVPRFYDPQEGRVTIDGVDLREVKLNSLVDQIAMVTQETFLFHTSILDNLRYARPQASDAEIIAAARAANIHDFIVTLPQGYQTIVGERGFRLSGGERQRIAIARALLKNPRILILDEATSALDSQSEALIQQALVPLMEGRTNIVIAHRLSTILAADTILVLHQGRLIEQGTHAELLRRNGLYALLYQQQFHTESRSVPHSARL